MKKRMDEKLDSITYVFYSRILIVSLSNSSQDLMETFIEPTRWASITHTLVAKSQSHYLDFNYSKMLICSVNHFHSK